MKKTNNKKKKETNFIKDNYKKCFTFFKESTPHIKFATILFFGIALIGFIFPIFFREQIFEIMRQMIEQLEGVLGLDLVKAIFLNNIKASFLSMILGIGVAIFPISAAITNGYLLGFVSREVIKTESPLILLNLIPHGIFEIPAILLSIGIGIKLGTDIFKKNAMKITKKNIKESLRFFVFVIFPLILLAAIIEGILITLAA